MNEQLRVVTAPKDGTFQIRIDLQVKDRLEQIYNGSGLSLTDAVNAFFQQTLNVGGLPFLVTPNSKEALRQMATVQLMEELQKGIDPLDPGERCYSRDEILEDLRKQI